MPEIPRGQHHSSLSFIFRRECSAPSRAFDKFVSKAELESWLTSLADVEPRLDGKYELFREPDDPENNSTIGCNVTAIVPDRLPAFEWRSPEQYKHFANDADPLSHGVISFAPDSDGTDVHLIHSG